MSLSTDPEELPSPLTKRLEQEREALDRQLAVIRKEIDDLSMKRNGKALINAKLPDEVLYNVFLLVKDPKFYDPDHVRWNRKFPSWIQSTTHVCRHWRTIALSKPTLWTTGFPTAVDGMLTFLERSKPFPISFTGNILHALWGQRTNMELRALVFSHLGRVKTLHLDIPESPEDTSAALKALDTDMPHLEALHLACSSYWTRFDAREEDVVKHLTFPRPSNLKHVRDLQLERFGLDWDRVELRNLTTLCITGKSPAHLRTSARKILDVLRLSPELKTLKLCNLVSPDLDGEDAIVADFSLPKLTHFQLHEDGTRLAKALVNSDVLPELQHISLTISTHDEQTMTDLMVAAAQRVDHNPPMIIEIRTHELTPPDVPEPLIMFSYVHDPSGDYTFDFENKWDASHTVDVSRAIQLCLEGFDLDELEKFDCGLRQPLSKEWWRSVLGRAAVLQTLRTEGLVNPAGLINALTPDNVGHLLESAQTNDTGSGSRGRGGRTKRGRGRGGKGATRGRKKKLPIPLSSVSLVTFAKANFTPCTSRGDDAEYEEGSLKHLSHCLHLRKECGHKLDMVAIPGTSKDHRKSGARLSQKVGSLICMDDEGVEEHSEYEFTQAMWFSASDDELL